MDYFKKKIYDNYISNHNNFLYGETTLQKIENYFPALKHYYARHIPGNKDISILDIGCGLGNFVYFLSKCGYKDVSGIDFSAEQVAAGTRLGIPNLFQADLKVFLAESKKQYDVIILKDIIEHFDRNEVFEIMELLHKNIKDGGRFIMQVPNGQGLYYTSIFYGDYTHEMAYTESSINQVILNNGFKSSRCYPTGPIPNGIVPCIRYALWGLKVFSLKFWKMVETGNPRGIFTQNIIAVVEK